MIVYQLIRMVVLVGAGISMGLWFSRQKRTWVWGYILPVSLSLVFAICCWFPRFAVYPPFSLLLAWPRRLVIMLFGISLLFSTIVPKLPQKTSRKYITFFAGICIVYFSTALVLPTLLRGRHSNMHNTADKSEVCRQSTPYTCGPASTVSALAHYGIRSEEGTLAILTHCTPLLGTQPEDIVRAVNRHYGDQGIQARRRNFESPAGLPKGVPVIIAIEFSFLIDHFIVAKNLGDGRFLILDPIAGKSFKSGAQLRSIWRGYGVVIANEELVAHRSSPRRYFPPPMR